MAKDLDELHERVQHCRDEWVVLRNDIDAFVKSGIEITTSPGITVGVWAKLIKPIPVSIRSRAGSITNELRSSLDALACRLAERNGHTDLAGVYFPAAKNSETFPEEKKKKLKKLSKDDQDRIDIIQPFGGGHPFVFKLHEADRVRKHQKLLSFKGTGKLNPVGSGYVGFMAQQDDEWLTEVGQNAAVGLFHNVTTGVQVSFELVYSEPDLLKGAGILETLYQFIEATDQIISVFD